MDTQRLRRHLDLLPRLHLAYGGLLVLLAVIVLWVRGDAPAGPARLQAYALVATLLAMGAVAVWAAVELRHRMSLGRNLALLLSLPSLFFFPIGTAVGLYTVWLLMAPEVEGYYLPRRQAPA